MEEMQMPEKMSELSMLLDEIDKLTMSILSNAHGMHFRLSGCDGEEAKEPTAVGYVSHLKSIRDKLSKADGVLKAMKDFI